VADKQNKPTFKAGPANPSIRVVQAMNVKNFYIIASAPNEPTLQVNISGPYLTKQAAEADLAAAINEAVGLDPAAKEYEYTISKIACQKPGVIQHMACHMGQRL